MATKGTYLPASGRNPYLGPYLLTRPSATEGNGLEFFGCNFETAVFALHLRVFSKQPFFNFILSQVTLCLKLTARHWRQCTWERPSWCSFGQGTPPLPSSRCTSRTSSSTRTTPPSWSNGSQTLGKSSIIPTVLSASSLFQPESGDNWGLLLLTLSNI